MPAPLAGERAEWSAEFGRRFTVFVDTEEEFDWRAPLSRGNRQVTAMRAIPAAHARFAEWAVPLTYMADHPAVAEPAGADILRGVLADGRSAIGAQLHAWVTPPFAETLTPANSFAGNLPEGLEAAKLDALTSAITEATGAAPIAFRAGRYGLGRNSLRLLAERGYRLDSSVRAYYDYGGEGGPDFRSIGNAAFWRDGILELPFTTLFTGRARVGGTRLFDQLGRVPRGRGIAARLGLLSRVSLTPEDMPLSDVLEAIAVADGEGLRMLNFAFHSPSLAPGHTPYVRDAGDLRLFWRWWDEVLAALDRRSIRPASLHDVLAAATPSVGGGPGTHLTEA
ncbi:polysaccharide deacetylase family protein [Sphingomonas aracearum]|uniref:WalW protein n=1 Tax=Sphingomonas aracearum TaxID=2283317 RepID=A0A369W5R6_9SPHN|nr:polysaccharide deacetylase family protein [Sphingomonas aracearum]RDE07431.1 WalW protein [Sphingomonas aracearum]